MPASCCGVVGLKPTRGRITAAPAVPYPGDLSVDFAITRSIRDTAALLDAVAGPSPGDPYSIAPPAGSYLAAIGERPEKLRIAVSTTHMWQRRTDPEVAGAVEAVAALCEDLGHTVVEAAPTFDWEPYVEATLDVWCAMLADAVAWAAGETGRDPSRAHLEGHTRAWAERGRTLSAVSLGRAVQMLGETARDVGRFFTEYDVLLSATVPTLPIELGHYDPDADVPVSWYYESAVGDLESTTSLFNCTGQPAISLPLRTSAGGLPIGIHLAAAFGQERTLLRLASALEEACPWATRRPSVWAADAI
jgi:amidase